MSLECQLRRAIPKGPAAGAPQDQNGTQIFVGGIGADVTAQDLRNYFSQFGGTITDAQVMSFLTQSTISVEEGHCAGHD